MIWEVLFWMIVFLFISFFLGIIWSKISTSNKYYILIFPGVIIHEFSHILGCFLTGAKITDVKFFTSKGSYVKHKKPKIPFIGTAIIGLFPIVGGIASLYLFSYFLGFNLPYFEIISANLYESFIVLIKSAVDFFSSYWGKSSFWFFLYLSISIIICLIPSKQDFKNSFSGIIFTILIFIIFNYLNWFSDFTFFLLAHLMSFLTLGIFLGIISLIVSGFIYFLKKIL